MLHLHMPLKMQNLSLNLTLSRGTVDVFGSEPSVMDHHTVEMCTVHSDFYQQRAQNPDSLRASVHLAKALYKSHPQCSQQVCTVQRNKKKEKH